MFLMNNLSFVLKQCLKHGTASEYRTHYSVIIINYNNSNAFANSWNALASLINSKCTWNFVKIEIRSAGNSVKGKNGQTTEFLGGCTDTEKDAVF